MLDKLSTFVEQKLNEKVDQDKPFNFRVDVYGSQEKDFPYCSEKCPFLSGKANKECTLFQKYLNEELDDADNPTGYVYRNDFCHDLTKTDPHKIRRNFQD